MLFTLFFAVSLPAKVLEGLEFSSKMMKKPLHFAVYLPPDYDSSNRRYPVLYLLHGYTDNETGWIQFGEVPQIADRLIEENAIAPMIIIMPDGGVTWYMNDAQGRAPYEDMIIKEFVPYVDGNWRTRPTRGYRAVGGLSMGGYGSLLWSLHHPEVFGYCVALSAAVRTLDDILSMEQKAWDQRYADLVGPGLQGEARLTPHFRNQMILDLVKTTAADSMKKVGWWIDCGDDDFLSPANALLHIALKEKQIPHEFRMRDGKHSWPYWRSGIVDGLKFISAGFHK
jgi:enterochelin esterase-like enzyme